MGISDAEYKLVYIDAGINGRHSDGGVFKRCSFYRGMIDNQIRFPGPRALPGCETPMPFVIVGDDAFALTQNLMKPYAQRNLTGSQRVFNYRLSRTRRIIENVFGIMSARFRVLRSPILLNPDKARLVTKACAALHNFLMQRNRSQYAPPGTFDHYGGDGTRVNGSWREEDSSNSFFGLEPTHSLLIDGKQVREEFERYFISEGEVAWQYGQI